MILLHGIYGAGRNWGSVARRLVRARPGWSVALVDMRSHGRSPRLSPHNVDACAGDLRRLEDHLDRTADAVLGHSYYFRSDAWDVVESPPEGGHRLNTDNPGALHELLIKGLPTG